MSFINQLINKPLALLTVASLTLGGCASAPEQSEQPIAAETTQTKALSPQEQRYQELVNSTNAYLGTTQVPANVQTEVANALALKAQGDVEAASKQLKALNKQYPQYSGIALQLGDIASADNDLELAKVYYSQAVSINKYNYYAHNRLGSVLRKLGEFSEAGAHYQAAILSWPGFAPAYLNLGILNDIYLGNKQVALEHYQTYQLLTKNSNRKVKGWIADINAQLKAQQRRANNG